ncbi:uncharacterized protein LOC124201648 [Daphnia pulex]|uniref:uncharacterized protein LOC124201648 n=1 Tax=Daphnia pulex TaxID=6669 RepID=UPI001EDE90E9|nr:uncharacterized protein LOC124201648 [Daphnia pulex]
MDLVVYLMYLVKKAILLLQARLLCLRAAGSLLVLLATMMPQEKTVFPVLLVHLAKISDLAFLCTPWAYLVNKADRAKMVFPSLPELLVTLAAQAPLDLKANLVHLGTLARLERWAQNRLLRKKSNDKS